MRRQELLTLLEDALFESNLQLIQSLRRELDEEDNWNEQAS